MSAASPAYSEVSVIGSRRYRGDIDYALMHELWDATTIISGGALGVDRAAEEYGAAKGIRVVSYRPRKASNDSGRYFVEKYEDCQFVGAVCDKGEPIMFDSFAEAAKARNWWIVRDGGRTVALWDGTSSGTSHGIAAATRFRKPVRIWMEGDS